MISGGLSVNQVIKLLAKTLKQKRQWSEQLKAVIGSQAKAAHREV